MEGTFRDAFCGLPVLVTGHTGFKGSWLSIWLHELGAKVIGYSLDPPTDPSNLTFSRLVQRIVDVRGDVRDLDALCETIARFKPQIIFHLAAQAIVPTSYACPKETFDTNVGGTVNVLEAIRQSGMVRVGVFITSDKCYANQEWIWGYRENDPLGGHDPYSMSKAMAELAIASYLKSFFSPDKYAQHQVAIASTRAGNVIGGGDWSRDRIVTDAVRALTAGQAIRVRNPRSVRPWQHVLEPLSGYLWLAARLLGGEHHLGGAWNFGPAEMRAVSVRELVEEMIACWGEGKWQDASSGDALHETALLRVSWEKAANLLDWQPVYTWREAVRETVAWFRQYHARETGENMYGVCVEQIVRYVARARELGVAWALSQRMV